MCRLFGIIGLSGLLVWSQVASAQQGPEEDQFYLNLLGAYVSDPAGLEVDDNDYGFGGGLGYAFTDKWMAEAMYYRFDPDVKVNNVEGNGDLDYWSVNLIRTLGDSHFWRPYVTIGGGQSRYDYDSLRTDVTETTWSFGAGFFKNLNNRVVFRADYRGLYHNKPDTVSSMATVGFTVLIGDPPAPPPPPAPLDSDGDGVIDDNDACPGTPLGTAVDSRGCPLDSDGDGVPDSRDECPGTPAGARVDERGCEIVLEKPVSFDLTVEFAFNSDEITGVAFQEMLELLRFLREYPSTNAVIEGHSDSIGAEAYNQQLSERRAQAVVTALTNSGIESRRLSAVGYGESKPIASNATEEGRQKNRRVTVVVSGTTKTNCPRRQFGSGLTWCSRLWSTRSSPSLSPTSSTSSGNGDPSAMTPKAPRMMATCSTTIRL